MTDGSADWFAKAQNFLPGGVSSPVRAFGAVGGTPPVIRSASGAEITDEDGRTYLDFVGSWGPLILGHAHPEVVEAVGEAAKRGMSFGAPCRAEIELAEVVVDAYPGIEQVRFVFFIPVLGSPGQDEKIDLATNPKVKQMTAGYELDWDLLESRYEDAGLILFEKRIDRLRNPRNEQVFERLVLESADWVNVVALDAQRRSVMIRRNRLLPPGFKQGQLLTDRGWDFTPQAEAMPERPSLCAAA